MIIFDVLIFKGIIDLDIGLGVISEICSNQSISTKHVQYMCSICVIIGYIQCILRIRLLSINVFQHIQYLRIGVYYH